MPEDAMNTSNPHPNLLQPYSPDVLQNRINNLEAENAQLKNEIACLKLKVFELEQRRAVYGETANVSKQIGLGEDESETADYAALRGDALGDLERDDVIISNAEAATVFADEELDKVDCARKARANSGAV